VAEAAVDGGTGLAGSAEEYKRGRERLFDRRLLSLRDMHTGSDGLTNTVTMKVGLRLPPQFDVDELVNRAQDLAGEATVQAHGHEPAFAAGRQNHLVRAFNCALRQRGLRPRYVLKTGTSDMNVVGPRWGCPIVAYGPGDSTLDHTPHEHLHLEEYLQAIDVLADVLGSI
jgi:LysW-gamma-L-lysine carboxypeptidase